MSDLTLSLLGLYNQDPEILDQDHLILPEGVDREVLLPMILSETAELEVIYPNPDTLKIVMAAWSTARSPSWERMLETLLEAYDPLYNYDRTETETGSNTGTDHVTDAESITDTTAEDITDSLTEDIEDSLAEGITDTTDETVTDTSEESGSESTSEDIRDTTNGTTGTTATGQVTGFNSSSFADNNKTVTSGSSSDTAVRDRDQVSTSERSGSTERDRDQTITRDREQSSTRDREQTSTRDRDESYHRGREASRTSSSTGGHSRNLRAYGNIGVTTSQARLLEELRVRMTDIYRIITDELAAYFCLRVY